MPATTAPKNIGGESSRALVVALAVLAMGAGASLMLIGTNLGILYALVAVFAVFAVIVVVVAPVLGIVVFVGTLLLGLPWFLAGDGRLTANNLLGLILFAVLIVQVCLTRDLRGVPSAPLLGVGPGDFRWLHRERYPYALSAGRPNHNSYLWAATEGGIPTVLLYLVLFYSIWRDLRTAQRLYPQGDVLWHVTRFLRGFFFIWVFFSIFADFWLEVHLYLIAGLAMLLIRRRFDDDAEEAPAAASTRPPLPVDTGPAALLPSGNRA